MDDYFIFDHEVNELLLTGAPYHDFELKKTNQFQGIYAQRKKLWADFILSSKQHKKPLIILLNGSSSVGKSSWAVEIAYRLGMRNIIHTDTLRGVLRSLTDRKKEPALFDSTYKCWEAYSDHCTREALVKGFQDQCRSITASIETIIKDATEYGKFTIIEGMHIVPSMLKQSLADNPNVVTLFLDIDSREVHESRLVNRCNSTYLNREHNKYVPVFDEFRILRDYLFEEANESSSIIVNNTDQVETLDCIMSNLFQRLSDNIQLMK